MAQNEPSAAEIGRRAAEAAIGSARHGARRLGEEVRDAGVTLLTEQKHRLVDTMQGFAHALHHSAETLRHEHNQVAAGFADQAAAQLERVAGNLREQELSDFVAGAETLARRQPALFIMGAVGLGFLAARLIAASSSSPRSSAVAGPEAYAPGDGDRAWREGPHAAEEPLAGAGWGR